MLATLTASVLGCVMSIRGACFAYVICVGSAVAATTDDRANEMAECGYLAHMAVEQMKKLPERPQVYDQVVREVVTFTSLFHHLKGEDTVLGDAPITGAMLFETARVGKSVHDDRTRAMSPQNALRLSNRVLNMCRSDLALFGKKLKIR